jgi:hypothetical protein
MTRPTRGLPAPLSLLAWMALGAAPGHAAVAPLQVAVRPASGPSSSYFSVAARPKHVVRVGRVELINRGRQRLTVDVVPVDALTASTLGSAYAVPGLALHVPARWTVLSARRIKLAGGATATVDVSARVPPRAAPGQYLSGISVEVERQAQTQRKAGSNIAVSSVIRYAIGLELSLPGRRNPRLAWTGASLERAPGGLTFLLAARNEGNRILQNVTGSVLITQGRRVVAHRPIGPGTFVTGTSIEYPAITAGEVPAEGTVYRVRARMRYGPRVALLDRQLVFGARQARTQHQFGGPAPHSDDGGTPWALIAAVAGAALALALGAFLIGVRRGRR